MSAKAILVALGFESGFCRLQGARGRHQEYSDVFTTSQCGRDRRRPSSVLFGSQPKLRDGGGVCHSKGRAHHLCPVERRLVIRDVFQPEDRRQCLGLGKVISPEGNRNRRTLILHSHAAHCIHALLYSPAPHSGLRAEPQTAVQGCRTNLPMLSLHRLHRRRDSRPSQWTHHGLFCSPIYTSH